jgi:hypothetical protein
LAATRSRSRRGLAVRAIDFEITVCTRSAATGNHVAREIKLRARLRCRWERRHPVYIAYARPLSFSRYALIADGHVRVPSKVVSDAVSKPEHDAPAQEREEHHAERYSLDLAR